MGWFGSAWNQERAVGEGVLITILVCLVVPMFSSIFFNSRFVIPFLPLLIIWAAKGVNELANWSEETAHNLLPGPRCVSRIGLSVSRFAIGGVLFIAWREVKTSP